MERLNYRSMDAQPIFYPLSTILAYEDSEQTRAAQLRNKTVYNINPYGNNLRLMLSFIQRENWIVCDSLKGELQNHGKEITAR